MATGGFFANFFGLRRDATPDERFIMHRFKSTRLAEHVGTNMIFVLFTYHTVVSKTIRWDLLSVIAAMAVVKVCALLYYRKTN
jgi:hypothetical protein